jgi:hypothetical protein
MWDELGIAPCDDPKAIRRAYAARLKKLDPERDPRAFARLRRAFEWALGQTEGDRARPASAARRTSLIDDHTEGELRAIVQVLAEKSGSAPATPGYAETAVPTAQESGRLAVLTAEDDVRDRALLIALDAALRRRNATEAMALFNRAAATGTLSLENMPSIVARLLMVAVDDAALDGAAFRKLTASTGWDRLDSRAGDDPSLRQRVQARLAAEDWYDRLVANADRPGGSVERYVARLLLKRTGRFFMHVQGENVRPVIAQYRIREQFLGERIDPHWVARLERRLRRRAIVFLTIWGLLVLQFFTGAVAGFVQLFTTYYASAPFSVWPIGAMVIGWIFLMLGRRLMRLYRLAASSGDSADGRVARHQNGP